MKYSIPYVTKAWYILFSNSFKMEWFLQYYKQDSVYEVLGILLRKILMFTQNLYRNVYCFICSSPNWKQTKSPSTVF